MSLLARFIQRLNEFDDEFQLISKAFELMVCFQFVIWMNRGYQEQKHIMKCDNLIPTPTIATYHDNNKQTYNKQANNWIISSRLKNQQEISSKHRQSKNTPRSKKFLKKTNNRNKQTRIESDTACKHRVNENSVRTNSVNHGRSYRRESVRAGAWQTATMQHVMLGWSARTFPTS